MTEQIPLVSIIIINWNGKTVIERCLRAVFDQTFQNFEIIVVDNGSTDGSLQVIADLFPQIRLIQLESNHGFAHANNVASAQARGQWLALINSDVFPEPDWLQAMLDASQTHPDLYFFTSCQIQANDPNLLDGTGDQYNIGGIAWRRQINQPVENAVPYIDEVFSACGAAALIPRDAFLETGGFDEDYFSYLEDVDLGFRLRLLGYRCLYVPRARVLHVGSASLGVESEFAIYHTLRNMVWTFLKDMPFPYVFFYLPVHLGMYVGYSLFYAFCCCPCVSLKAFRDTIIGIPATLRKRKIIQAKLQVDPLEVVRMIKRPPIGKRNLLGLFFLPKLILTFIQAVKECRSRRAELNPQ